MWLILKARSNTLHKTFSATANYFQTNISWIIVYEHVYSPNTIENEYKDDTHLIVQLNRFPGVSTFLVPW